MADDITINDVRALRFCPECNSNCINLIDWHDMGGDEWGDFWMLHLRCCECEITRQEIVPDPIAMQFEEYYDDEADETQKSLTAIEVSNFKDYMASFIVLLNRDVIGPEDF